MTVQPLISTMDGAFFKRGYRPPVEMAFACEKYRLPGLSLSCRQFYRHMRGGRAACDRRLKRA